MATCLRPLRAMPTRASDDVCLLAFTSGTTGQPKACVHFHRDVLAMARRRRAAPAEDVAERRLLPAARRSASPSGSARCSFSAALPRRDRADRGAGARGRARGDRASPDHLPLHGALRLSRARRRARAAAISRRSSAASRRASSCRRRSRTCWFEKTGIRIIDGIGATEMIHIFVSAERRGHPARLHRQAAAGLHAPACWTRMARPCCRARRDGSR